MSVWSDDADQICCVKLVGLCHENFISLGVLVSLHWILSVCCRWNWSALKEALVFTEVSLTGGHLDGRLWLFMSRSPHLLLPPPPVSPITLPLPLTHITIIHSLLIHFCQSCLFFVVVSCFCDHGVFFLFDSVKFSVWVNLCVCACVCVFVCVSLAHCVDSKTSAVRVYGDTWLRWRGPRVEYCRCALRGRELCHIVPVMSEWDTQAHLDSLTRVTSTWLILTRKYALDL